MVSVPIGTRCGFLDVGVCVCGRGGYIRMKVCDILGLEVMTPSPPYNSPSDILLFLFYFGFYFYL